MTTDYQDEKNTPATLLGRIWPLSPFMVKIVQKTLVTLWDFIDGTDDFVNAEDTL